MKNHYPLIFSWKNSRITKKIIYFAFEFVNLRMKKVFLWIGIVLLSPILLFVILTVLLYCPPVQNWAVQRVVAVASEKLGADVSVGYVCLKFPLDLSLEHFVMVQHADTVADIGRLVVDVQLRPLFDNKVIVNELEIDHAKVNTSDFIAAARVKGRLQHLQVSSRGIDLDRQTVEVMGGRTVPDKVRFSLATRDDSGDAYDMIIHEDGREPAELVARIPYKAEISFATDDFGF